MDQTHDAPGYDEQEMTREHEAIWRRFIKVGTAAVAAIALVVILLALITL